MNELWQCNICKSLIPRDQIDGQCRICKEKTCNHCKRVCDKCQQIVCMLHLESKIVMRQQQPYVHKLCQFCGRVWV